MSTGTVFSAETVWTAYRLFALALFGATIGSFLNVCAYRIPLGRSIVRPGSACTACGTLIRWQHNIPVFSWLYLRGRCASCRTRISARYPLVEAGNALLWVLVGWRFGPTIGALVLLPFVSAMIVLFLTDLDHQLLPDRITLPLAVAGLVVAPWNARLDLGPWLFGSGTPLGRLVAALVGAVIGYGVFFTLALAWRVLFDREALGGGDLKMMLGVGAFLGAHGVLLTIFLASLIGTLLSLPALLSGRWRMTHVLPFGCFLAPAAVVAMFYAPEIIRWYLGLLVWPV
ncbi:MAG: prepilin peptidase [Acidobacteriota bacterium]|nr:MAG: prepilin peptidase [Acidobacteriota bacterium]